ncbi:MAG: GxxExxY protein [Verrucomicrobiales bacterium]
MKTMEIAHQRQLPISVHYKDVDLDCGYRIDMLVEGRLPVELKAVETTLPIHIAQLLTYMRLGSSPLGLLLLNVETAVLRDGIRRLASSQKHTASPDDEINSSTNDALSMKLLHSAIEGHRHLGPGLLRSAYRQCLCYELGLLQLPFELDYTLPNCFEGTPLSTPISAPLLVNEQIPVICLSASTISPLHEATLLSRLHHGDWPYGYILNFNAPYLKDGIRKITR